MKSLARLIFLFFKNRSGAAAVEFVLIAPIFIGIIIGGFDIGRYIFLQHELTSVVQDAGRFAMIRGASTPTPATPGTVINYATQKLQFNNAANVTFTVTYTPNNSAGSTVQVRGQASFEVVGGLFATSALALDAVSTNIIVN